MSLFEHILKYYGYTKDHGEIKQGQNSIPVKEKENESCALQPTIVTTQEVKSTPVSPDKIVLAQSTSAALLQLDKVSRDMIPSGYRCLPMERNERQTLYNVLSTGAGIASYSAAMTPLTGLYKATAPAGSLMKLSTGGFSSSVVGQNGKIVAQKGFVEAGKSAFTPMIAFQIMSIVTGRYYLNGINKQLTAINEKLDFIIKELEAEKQGKLNSAVILFKMMASQHSYSLDDLMITRMKMVELLDLYQFYVIRMQEEYESILKEKKGIINWTNCGDVEEMKKILGNSRFFAYNEKAEYCYQVYCFGEMLYLKMLACSMNQDPLAMQKFEEMIMSFKPGSKSILSDTFNSHKALFDKLNERIRGYVEYKQKDASSYKQTIQRVGNSIKSGFDQNRLVFESETIKSIQTTRQEIVQHYEKPRELLYHCSEDGETYVFCLDKPQDD